MTKIKFLLPILAAVSLLTGCGTFWGNKPITPQRVQSIVQSAVEATAVTWTTLNKDTVPKFKMALDGVNKLVASKNWDINALKKALTGSGATIFTSDQARMLISDAKLIVTTALGDEIDLSQVEYARAVIIGSQEGLQFALEGK